MSIKLLRLGQPPPWPANEPVLAEMHRFRAISSYTRPSYKIGFNLPLVQHTWLLVSARRCVVRTRFLGCLWQEIVAWYPGQNPPDDPETLLAAVATHGLFGPCLELRQHDPRRRAWWLWSPALTLRFFYADPAPLAALIAAQLPASPAN